MSIVKKLATRLESKDSGAVFSRPDATSVTDDSLISSGVVKYKFVDVEVDPGEFFKCVVASSKAKANGRYLHMEAGKCTVATMDAQYPIVAAGNFTGGEFRVYRSASSTYKCVHVYAPQGDNLSTARFFVSNCAKAQGWTLIGTSTVDPVRLRRYAGGEVFFVSLLTPGDHVDIFQLLVGAKGNVSERPTKLSVPA